MTTETKKSKAADVAEKFLAACKAEGFSASASASGIVQVTRKFSAGSRDEFVFCGMTAPGLLMMLGAKCGSMWGTDGGGIGGMSALHSGRFKLNISGGPRASN